MPYPKGPEFRKRSAEACRRWRHNHPDRHLKTCKKARERIKRIVFRHYSPFLICMKCGFSDIRALSIHHIEGGGRAQRIAVSHGKGGVDFYMWLRRNNYPPGFQVLCMNCHMIMTNSDGE